MTQDTPQGCSPGSVRDLAEELREYTAMKYAGDCKCGKCQLVPRALVERIYHTLNSAGGVAQRPVDCGVTDAMCEAAIDAEDAIVDRIQGFSYNTRHVIRDVRMPWTEQEIWSTPIAGPDEYQAFQKRCQIERMRRVLAAALSLPSTHQPIANPSGLNPGASGASKEADPATGHAPVGSASSAASTNEATAAQHFYLPKGEPAHFVRNGVLETCQCRRCSALSSTQSGGAAK